jgi:hypothetical protein
MMPTDAITLVRVTEGKKVPQRTVEEEEGKSSRR